MEDSEEIRVLSSKRKKLAAVNTDNKDDDDGTWEPGLNDFSIIKPIPL